VLLQFTMHYCSIWHTPHTVCINHVDVGSVRRSCTLPPPFFLWRNMNTHREDTFTVDLTGISILIRDECFLAAELILRLRNPKTAFEQNALRELDTYEQRLTAARSAKKN